jgi:hypothetical protein
MVEHCPGKTSRTEQQSVVPLAGQVIGSTNSAQPLDTAANIKVDVQNATFRLGGYNGAKNTGR